MVKVLVKIFELTENPGGDVDGVKPKDAFTRTTSGASGEADIGPHQSGERGAGEKPNAAALRRSSRWRGGGLGLDERDINEVGFTAHLPIPVACRGMAGAARGQARKLRWWTGFAGVEEDDG